MNEAEQILVVFLSTALAVFLTLSIILTVQGIRVMRTVQRIAEKAETIVETAEHVGTVLKNVSGPLGVLQIVRNIVDVTNNKQKRGR
jgi:membrane protein implicated in regulation of membrane protease activity